MNYDRCMEEIFSDKEWRLKELYYMRNLYKEIVSNDENETKIEYLVYTRMITPLIYAHWEGFTKFSFEKLIEFLNKKNIPSKDCILSLFTHAQTRYFDSLKGKQNFKQKCLFSKNFLEVSQSDIRIDNKINTKSNLKYEILEEILTLFSIETTSYTKYKTDIDRLVNMRNSVCHGELSYKLNDENINNYITKITELMDQIISDISKYIQEENYLNKDNEN